MNRREFLKRMGAFSMFAAGSVLVPGRRILAQDASVASVPDLVAVKGGAPAVMFDRGIAAIGGMRRFVKTGDTVAIKPNISWNSNPEQGANTNPELVKRVVEHCIDAGASRVLVFDNTLDSWRSTYSASGIENAVKDGGGTMVPANSNRYYQEIDIEGAKILTRTRVHELVLESDVFINIPVLKHHGSTRITAAMKNLMGVVWDRQFYHSKGLNQCIADFPLARTPDLNIVDAYRVMMSGGPRGSAYALNSNLMKMQIIGTDIVAVDTASALTWGIEPGDIRYIGFAARNGLGTDDLSNLAIERILL